MTAPASSRSFVQELRRRNVIRVGLAYVVVSWVLLQVGDVVFEALDLDSSANRLLLAILAIGFVPALIFAWVFELTPEGLKRDSEVPLSESRSTHTARKLDIAVILLVLVGIALLALDRIIPEQATVESAPPANVTSNAANLTATAQDDASIAVLSFADLSPAGDQQYFSDGIAEEILNVLARVEGLRVASRTSAFQFKSAEGMGVPEIARKLDVRHVLEGSVRKAGNTIRITAQLIDADNDQHLWSETYDRQLSAENIFAIQDEIARSIVAALSGVMEMSPMDIGQVSVDVVTSDIDAYQLYLEARAHFRARQRFDDADRLLTRAVELDPTFDRAWALRAALAMLAGEYGWDRYSIEENIQRVQDFAGKALDADPDNALAIAVLAQQRRQEIGAYRARHDIGEIISDLERAVKLDPKDGSAYNWLGITYGMTGHMEQALEQFESCVEVEPYYAACAENVYDALAIMGRMDEALATYIEVLERGAVTAAWVNFELLVHAGLKAHFLYTTNQPNLLSGWHRHDEIWDAWNNLDQDHDDLLRDIRSFIQGNDLVSDEFLAMLLVPLGAYDLDPYELHSWSGAFRAYRQSEAFDRHIRRTGILEYWQKEGFPPQCEAVGEDGFHCD